MKNRKSIRTGKMPTLFFLFLVLMSTGREALSQATTLRLRAFEGTWNASYNGKTIIVVRLGAVGDHLSGTVQLAGFQLDLEGDGGIMAVTDSRLDAPIGLNNIRLQGKTLSFEFVDNDGDTDKFQMELSGRDSATLSWVGLPNGMKAKPIALMKQSPRSR